jgi:hypothetical protein
MKYELIITYKNTDKLFKYDYDLINNIIGDYDGSEINLRTYDRLHYWYDVTEKDIDKNKAIARNICGVDLIACEFKAMQD